MFKLRGLKVFIVFLFSIIGLLPLEVIADTSVNINMKVIDGDLNIKPIPKYSLEIFELSKQSSFIDGNKIEENLVKTVITNFNGNVSVELPIGRYVLKSKNPLVYKEKEFFWNYKFRVGKENEINIELSNDNSEIIEHKKIKKKVIIPEIKLFDDCKDGVITVESDSGHGSGFIIDRKGLVLTNHHVINDSLEFRVAFDDQTKVKAKLLTASPEEDVAVLYVNLDAYPKAKVLKIANIDNDTPIADIGEKVIAIGSPLNQHKILTSGIVSKVTKEAIISDVNANPGNSGGPLINSLGEVIGIITFLDYADYGPGVSGVINIKSAKEQINKAYSMIASGKVEKPVPEVIPSFADKYFPIDAFKEALTKKYRFKDYLRCKGPFNIMAYSPPAYYNYVNSDLIKAFKHKKSRIEKTNISKVTINSPEINSDNPLLEIRKWSKNLGKYDPFFIVYVEPKIGYTGTAKMQLFLAAVGTGLLGEPINPGKLEKTFKDDFHNMELFVNGRFVEPIKRSRMLKRIIFDNEAVEMGDQTHCGMFYYDPAIFIPEDPERINEIKMKIYRGEGTAEPIVYVVRTKEYKRLIKDFIPYYDEYGIEHPNIETIKELKSIIIDTDES